MPEPTQIQVEPEKVGFDEFGRRVGWRQICRGCRWSQTRGGQCDGLAARHDGCVAWQPAGVTTRRPAQPAPAPAPAL